MVIKVVPLGAGQDVGRSCILLSINNKNVMLDCGMHMGYQVCLGMLRKVLSSRIIGGILTLHIFLIPTISMECLMQ